MIPVCKENCHAHFHGLPETPASNSGSNSEKIFFESAVFLAQRLYEKNPHQKIAILCDPADLNNLDEWLWTLSPESFLPHSQSGYDLIYLTSDPEAFTQPEKMPNILLHLRKEPAFNFITKNSQEMPLISLEIHHIVGKNPEYRESCRTLFREYKKNGIKISYQEILP